MSGHDFLFLFQNCCVIFDFEHNNYRVILMFNMENYRIILIFENLEISGLVLQGSIRPL